MRKGSFFNNYKSQIFQEKSLTNLDLINKYTITSVNKVPNIKRLIIDVSLKDIEKLFHFMELSQKDLFIKIFTSVVFFHLFDLPFLKTISKSDETTVFKVTINQEEALLDFLFLYLIETSNKKSYSLLLKNSKKLKLKNLINLRTFFDLKKIDEINTFLNEFVYIKEFIVKLNFLIHTPITIKNYDNLIKNLPYFWVIK